MTDDAKYDTDTAIAMVCHEANRAWCASLNDNSQPSWADAPAWQRESAIAGVRAHLDDPTTTPERSHQLWMDLKISEGWTYGDVKDPAAKTHPCMVPYDRLPAKQRAKDHLFSAIVRALGGQS